jgi:hypothetical protein
MNIGHPSIKYIIFGFLLGIVFFLVFENGKPGNTFFDSCWIRRQPSWLVHNKCYILGSLLIYREITGCNDPFVIAFSAGFIGLHLAQNIGEQYYLSNKNNLRDTG